MVFQKGNTLGKTNKGRKAFLGHIHSEETKKKIHDARIGKKHTKEAKLKISKSLEGNTYNLGHKHTEESKKKMGKLGKENGNWHGGISTELYSIDWSITLKRSIRERDRYTCQLCGEPQGDEALSIHHIDYIKKNCNPDNLITLCRKCHSRTNGNRMKWTKYFKEMMLKW